MVASLATWLQQIREAGERQRALTEMEPDVDEKGGEILAQIRCARCRQKARSSEHGEIPQC
jgi:hypothetical protein